MPKKYDECVKEIKRLLKGGTLKKTYINKSGKRVKTNPYAICRSSIKF